MSTSCRKELLVQYAWSSMHPPLQPFLKYTIYRAHISHVFARYAMTNGLTFQSPLIYQNCYVFEA